MTGPGVVVIGAGLAGAKTVEALRVEGFDGRIVLVGEETHIPYERPPLSKGYLNGTTERDSVFVHPEQWYTDHDVELRLRERVSWANALKQPAVAAASILGRPASYTELPYFYTDQYDLRMEYVGYAEPGGYDRVVFRGDPAKREYIAFWMSGGRVLAGMNVNVWDVTEQIKMLIRERGTVDPDRLADPAIPLAAV